MALTAMLRDVPDSLRAAVSMLLMVMATARTNYAEPAAAKVPGNGGRIHRAAQVGTIISVVVIATVALVGTLILAQIDSALPETGNPALENASASILDGFAGAMELVPVVLLVFVAALVIGVVQRMRMQG